MIIKALTVFLCLGCVAPLLRPVDAFAKPSEFRAFVVGIDYKSQRNSALVLKNALNDAADIRDVLKGVGIDGITYLENPEPDQIRDRFREFLSQLAPGQVALFYYSGHGIQLNGENHLLAGDGETLFSFNQLAAHMQSQARSVIMLVDACRNNPLRRQRASEIGSLTLTRGLFAEPASVNIPLETLVHADLKDGLSEFREIDQATDILAVFATAPGRVALDYLSEDDRNSPFTSILKHHLKRRGSLLTIISDVTKEVRRKTDERQIPWQQGSVSAAIVLREVRLPPP